VKLRFECTNNIAEYEACVAGLQAGKKSEESGGEYEACVAGLQAGKKSEESGGILRFSINHFSGER